MQKFDNFFAVFEITDKVFDEILPDLKIGTNSIIGAGSVVTRDVPDNVLVVGVPAKIIKSLQ